MSTWRGMHLASTGACGFFHKGVGVQKPFKQSTQPNQQQKRHQQNEHPHPQICPRGPACVHLSRGSCSFGGVFYHLPQEEEQEQQEQEQSLSQGRRKKEAALCWEDANCKRQSCRFTHLSLQDFPNLPQAARSMRNQWRLN